MHETVIANSIINEAKKHGKVTAITLDIGELAHVPGEELIECIKRLVDWKIEKRVITAVVECRCGYKGKPDILARGHDYFMIECPKCKEVPQLIDGKDIKIREVVVE